MARCWIGRAQPRSAVYGPLWGQHGASLDRCADPATDEQCGEQSPRLLTSLPPMPTWCVRPPGHRPPHRDPYGCEWRKIADPATADERIGDDIRDALADLSGPIARLGAFLRAWRDEVDAAPLPVVRLPPPRQIRAARVRLAAAHLRTAATVARTQPRLAWTLVRSAARLLRTAARRHP